MKLRETFKVAVICIRVLYAEVVRYMYRELLRLVEMLHLYDREICQIIHHHGGQVYLDGANMNAQVMQHDLLHNYSVGQKIFCSLLLQ